jgi:hypothetical protein
MTTANLHGWEFILKEDVEVIWDGVSDTEAHHVQVLKGAKDANGKRLVETGTANATIAFNLDAYIETDSNHYCLLMGPPNYFINGAKPMSALIRTDWYKTSPLQYCWQITTPNKPVLFPKGSPFLFILNYPKDLLETTSFSVSQITEKDKEKMNTYQAERQSYSQKNPGKFPNMYRKGVDGMTDEAHKFIEGVYKPNPGEVKYE